VVSGVLAHCERLKVSPPVSEVLAAFVARMVRGCRTRRHVRGGRGSVRRSRLSSVHTACVCVGCVRRQIIYDNPEKFPLDRPLTDDSVAEIVAASLRFLSQSDAPRVVTIRMQEAFDTSYFGMRKRLEDTRMTRESKLAELEVTRACASRCAGARFSRRRCCGCVCACLHHSQRAILHTTVKAAEDFDGRTALYRQIYSYVIVHSGNQVRVAVCAVFLPCHTALSAGVLLFLCDGAVYVGCSAAWTRGRWRRCCCTTWSLVVQLR
jgi:hypothetical protein